MSNGITIPDPTLSRRAFLGTTVGLLTGAVTGGRAAETEGRSRHPARGGLLRFATRGDAAGLDTHRHASSPVSTALTATMQGLLDLNERSEPVPGIAAAWDMAPDLLTYTFRLRKGVLFHNGREVDAAAVQWNLARMQNASIGHPFTRSALGNLKAVDVVDKYTIRCALHEPSAAFLADLVYYPCNLIAPESAESADTQLIGCGPFKLVKWERGRRTELARFAHYFETDAGGNPLPYLDGIMAYPKTEDQVRLTSLRVGEVDLVDNMAYTEAMNFPIKYAGKFQSWDVSSLGTSFILFNLERGPFADKRLRQAAAHAVDHDAIKQAVFYGRGETARGFYAPASPWYAESAGSWPAYDPDKAKFLLRQARALGISVILHAPHTYPYLSHTADLVQAMWSEVGFKVSVHLHGDPVLLRKRQQREFHAESMSASYRWDPDGWFSRQLLSTAPSTKNASGFRHAQADRLIVAARQTVERHKRLELYAAVERIVHEELPLLYLHHLTALQAGTPSLQGYAPAISGPFSFHAGGIRTASLR
jgi:peptide/nickel transport system substrate-binding protein